MLKKSLLSIVALTALCAAIPASAAESNFYGVFSLGRSKIDANSSSVDLYNTTHGFTSSSTSSQTSANGAKAQLGYNLGKTFALEGGYIYLGKADFSSITNLGTIGGSDVHWGLALGIVACLLCYGVQRFTTFGFAMQVIGGNPKTARMMGLNVGRYVLVACAAGGAAAGLAGMVEVAAVHGKANASLAVGYGFTGILVSFLARHHPLAIIPVAILLGGIGASGGLLQRRLDLPDAAVVVLQGIIFVCSLASETLYGRSWTWLWRFRAVEGR